MEGQINQKNIFEPAWPSEYHGLIRNEIAISVHDEKFISLVDDGNEISTETVFEKLRLASDAFAQLSDSESSSGDHYLVAAFYKNMSEGFKRLSNECIFKLNKDSALKINDLVEIVLEKIKV